MATRKRSKRCGSSSKLAGQAIQPLPEPIHQLTLTQTVQPAIPVPHAFPGWENPQYISLWVQEATAFGLLLMAANDLVNASDAASYSVAYSSYRSALDGYMEKWNAVHTCINGWEV